MLDDLTNITFRFYSVNKAKWESIIYSASDLAEAIRAMPDDTPGNDLKATALHEAQEFLENAFYNIVVTMDCICIASDCEFFDKLLPAMVQDEQCLYAEHKDAWKWGTDYPATWGTIDKTSIKAMESELYRLVNMPAIELSNNVKSVEGVLALYCAFRDFEVGDNDVIVWHGVYEEPDDPWDC